MDQDRWAARVAAYCRRRECRLQRLDGTWIASDDGRRSWLLDAEQLAALEALGLLNGEVKSDGVQSEADL